MLEIQIHIFGNVQGVGFRATTKTIAKYLGLSGYVKSCSDGSVEILAQGSKEHLQALLEKLNKHFSAYIQKVEHTFSEPKRDFQDFYVKI